MPAASLPSYAPLDQASRIGPLGLAHDAGRLAALVSLGVGAAPVSYTHLRAHET